MVQTQDEKKGYGIVVGKPFQKCNKQSVWKFTATSHGKRVVDGVGGSVKSTVCCSVISKGKNPIIVQDCESFVNAARDLVKTTKIGHIDETAIIA